MKKAIACASLFLLASAAGAQDTDYPQVPREFRAVWIATVSNIDWPSRSGLKAWEQQGELIAILNKAAALNMNAVVLQVRPATDALYASSLEPWSEYLSGQMGRPPEPYYDPLAFAVEEAHKRGLELHAWFNPYRSRHPSARSDLSLNHLEKTRPSLVRRYGRHLWLDPGDTAVRRHSLRVMTDVVRRYDIDGVHLDDYFYPYKERDSAGAIIDFPDSVTYAAYVKSGGRLERNDWRRSNVDTFIKELYQSIKSTKRWVKFGISPFGVWRPGYPESIKGFDAYGELYADSKKWLNEGWLDYWTPQLYWPIARQDLSYPVLLRWWVGENTRGRNVWPGNYTSRVGGTSADSWKSQEIIDQISVTRLEEGASGNVHFSAKVLMQDRDSIVERLLAGPYAGPALVPSSPWLDSIPPRAPRAVLRIDSATRALVVDLKQQGSEKVWRWVVRSRVGPEWNTILLPGMQGSHMFAPASASTPPDEVMVSAVDRVGNESSVVAAAFAPPAPKLLPRKRTAPARRKR
jgi:uncharacterized lipoprotein YddW (UPF0748 family)